MAFTLAVHVPIAGLSLLPLPLGLPLLFTPVHIAFLQLVIDPVCAIVFEAEPEESDVMRRPPRDPEAPLFGPRLAALSFARGAVVLAAVGALFLALIARGVPEPAARAAGFVALVACNFLLVVLTRSRGALLATALFRRNRAFWGMLAITAALLAAALVVPPLRALFGFAPPSGGMLGAALGTTLAALLLLAALQAIEGRLCRRPAG